MLRRNRLEHADLLHFISTLLLVFSIYQLISLILFSKNSNYSLRGNIPTQYLVWQIGIFLFLLILSHIQKLYKFSTSEQFQLSQIFLFLRWTLLAFSQDKAELYLGALLLSLWSFPLLSSTEDEEQKNWQKIAKVSLYLPILLLSLRTVHVFLQQAQVLIQESINRSNPSASDKQNYFFLSRRELLFTLSILSLMIVVHLLRQSSISLPKLSDTTEKWLGRILLLSVSLFFFYFMGSLLLHRVWGLSTPSFDFGVFNQIFHSINREGLPLSTLERDGLYSHFKVHISPIIYLVYPIFALIPRAETLQIASLLIFTSGLIPLYLLSKHFFSSSLHRSAFCSLYLLLPGLHQALFYDFHENVFLPALLLWLIYSFFARKTWLSYLSAFLLLAVKEDSVLYLCSASLFYFAFHLSSSETPGIASFSEQEKKRAIRLSLSLIAIAVLYFFLATLFLDHAGDGSMYYRFESLFQHSERSTWALLRDLFQNPSYLLSLIFQPLKLRYLFIVLFSTMALPFLHKEKAGFFLILPLLFMNLLSNYSYQYDIRFHYNFGSHSLLLVAAMLAFKQIEHRGKDNKKRIKGSSLLIIALISSLCLNLFFYQDHKVYIDFYQKHKERSQEIEEILKKIPRDQVIACGTLLSTRLADVKELYDYEFNHSVLDGRELDLVIIDHRYPNHKTEKAEEYFSKKGFVESSNYPSSEWLTVLERSESTPNAEGKRSSMP